MKKVSGLLLTCAAVFQSQLFATVGSRKPVGTEKITSISGATISMELFLT